MENRETTNKTLFTARGHQNSVGRARLGKKGAKKPVLYERGGGVPAVVGGCGGRATEKKTLGKWPIWKQGRISLEDCPSNE